MPDIAVVTILSPEEPARRAWITDALGFVFPDEAPTSSASAAVGNWNAARGELQVSVQRAHAQVELLRAALRKHPRLASLADFTLDRTELAQANLFAALPECWPTATDAAANAKASATRALDAFRKIIDSDGVLAACDDNPLGVRLALRRHYGTALTRLSSAMADL